MKLKQGPIGKIVKTYISDTEVQKIIGTDRNGKIKEIDIPKIIY